MQTDDRSPGAARGTVSTVPSAERLDGVPLTTVLDWYRLTHLGRLLEDKAATYIKKAMGWSYHAPFAGHDGIQLASSGSGFRANGGTSCSRTTATC
jgi:hypothetical protein